jgi:outer membrane protein OmpA-like peptidoglycan-associated protein
MRATPLAAAVLALTLGAACRQPETPAAEPDDGTSAAGDASAGGSSNVSEDNFRAPSGQLNEIAGALGLAAGPPVPAGLVPGGDCPPAGAGAAQEVTAQANASIPLKAGLTLAYTWMRTPQEEYECLIHVQSADSEGIETSLSCNVGDRDKRLRRRVCRVDLRNARMLHTVYGAVKVLDASGEEVPETIVGATAFSLSSSEFAALKRTGSVTQHYVELGPNAQLIKDGLGELRVEGRDTMRVVVNDRPIDVPVIKLRGNLTWWIRGQRLETSDTAVVLDDERFPVLIDQHSSNETAASRIQFVKITYPGGAGEKGGGGGTLEGGLLDNRRVDVYGIYFDFNSDRIRVESEPVLQEIGGIMKRHPDWRLSIDGHTDNVGGNTTYNLELSRRRSEAVRTALVNRFGIAADRLTSGGHGAAAPKDTNETPEGRARNRRVELIRR